MTHRIKTCLQCLSANAYRVSGRVCACFLRWYECELCKCAAEFQCGQKIPDFTPTISTLDSIVIAHSNPAISISQRLLFECSCHCAAGTLCTWASIFGMELFRCMPTHQCDFSRGQGEVMFVLVSLRKQAVSVCQGLTLGNLVSEPVSLINNISLYRCLYLFLIFPATSG